MKILRPIENGQFTDLNDFKKTIFLAGPCPRKREDFPLDWRNEAFKILESLNFDGTVITPSNIDYQEYRKYHPDTLRKQTEWEYKMMHNCTALVFWIPRDLERWPAFTTNIEFGEFHDKENVFCGWPKEAPKNDYIKIRLDMLQKHYWYDLRKVLMNTVFYVNSK